MISDLEVRRASLEDGYMTMVQRFESGQGGGSQPLTSTEEEQ